MSGSGLSIRLLSLIVSSVTLSALGQLLLKFGISSVAVQNALAIVHTRQHYDANLSQVFFDELEIPVPRYNLGFGSLSHGVQTGRMLQAIEPVLVSENPIW